MGMTEPSGGVDRFVGRLGDLNTEGKPNSRADLYNKNGEKIQSRWYDAEGKAIHNRDYKHGGNWTFPHDHEWTPNDNGEPSRERDHLPVNPGFI